MAGSVGKAQRMRLLLAMFKPTMGFFTDYTYFDVKEKARDTKFDRGCQEILRHLNMKWHPTELRDQES